MATRVKIDTTYFDADGNQTKDWEAMHRMVQRYQDGTEIDLTFDDLPENIRRAGERFGIKTTLSNAGQGGNGDAAEARLENLMEGNWKDVGGPRAGDLVEAYERAKKEAGQPYDVEAFKKRVLSESAEERSAYKQIPAIAVQLAAIDRERSEAKAKRAAEMAGTDETEALWESI